MSTGIVISLMEPADVEICTEIGAARTGASEAPIAMAMKVAVCILYVRSVLIRVQSWLWR
jgi:predicted membrane protein